MPGAEPGPPPASAAQIWGHCSAAYAFDGPALELGALVLDGVANPEARIRVPLSMLNRHGLGDVSGMAAPGVPSDRITKRAQETATDWQARGFPVEFLNLGGQGGTGVPVRATITSFGPILLSKVL